MPPVISIVGRSGVGKTTFLEKLLPELKRRGYRVATIKHHVHDFDIDQPGKDSWRLAQAGSDAVVISSPNKLALVESVDGDTSLDSICRLLGEDYDLVLTEGFKEGGAIKIEVYREELGGGLLCEPHKLLAAVSDDPLEGVHKCYRFADAAGVADLIEEKFLKKRTEPQVAMYVDGNAVRLVPFVQEFIAGTVLGMVSTLKGVKVTSSLDIALRTGGTRAGSPGGEETK